MTIVYTTGHRTNHDLLRVSAQPGSEPVCFRRFTIQRVPFGVRSNVAVWTEPPPARILVRNDLQPTPEG